MREKIILRSRAKKLEPALRMGKNGLSESFVDEMNKILEKKKLIKIKMLKPSLNRKEKADLIKSAVEKTNSELIESVGNVFVLHRK